MAMIHGGDYTRREKSELLHRLTRSIELNQAPEYKALIAFLRTPATASVSRK